MQKNTVEYARWLGQQASIKAMPFRVSPFYEVRVIREGKRTDITAELSKAYLEGYDEEEKVKEKKNEIQSK